MDTITHSLAGALIAHVSGRQNNSQDSLPVRTRVLCGAIAAAFPDIDYLTALINPLTFITYWHRGITHSFVMLPLWALLLGVIMALALRRLRQWKSFVYLCGIVLLSHIFLDMITSWDTQIFAPVSDYRVALQYAFVIDPIITAIISLALFGALYFRAYIISMIGIGILALYITSLAILHHHAKDIALSHVRTQDFKNIQVFVLPQPLSPFNWKLVISDKEGHWQSLLNIVKQNVSHEISNDNTNFFAIYNFYQPKQHLVWDYFPRFGDDANSRTVWEQADFESFRKFSLIPALFRVDNLVDETCIWFMDLRFYIPTLNTPFIYGMCKSHSSTKWLLYRIKLYSASEREIVNVPYSMFVKSSN